MTGIIQNGEDLHLPNSDPAIKKVRGYRRFLVGLDIAQGVDRTAYTIIRDERLPQYDPNTGNQMLGKRSRTVVTAAHVPPMSYDALAQVTRNLMRDPAIAGRVRSFLDGVRSAIGT